MEEINFETNGGGGASYFSPWVFLLLIAIRLVVWFANRNYSTMDSPGHNWMLYLIDDQQELMLTIDQGILAIFLERKFLKIKSWGFPEKRMTFNRKSYEEF